MKRLIGLLLGVLLVGGCLSNPFSDHYQPVIGMIPASNPQPLLETDEPRVEPGRNRGSDQRRMLQEGFVPIGEATFNASEIPERRAIEQARAVGAHRVLLYRRYRETVTELSSRPVSDFHTTMIRTPDGKKARVTHEETRTEIDTHHYRIYDYYASFWAKGTHPVFGACLRPLTTAETQRIGSNKGAVVVALVRESPAFAAEILEEDILVAVDDNTITGPNQAMLMLAEERGKTVTITLWRNGKRIVKMVPLAP